MKKYGFLVWPAYLVAAYLVIVPVLEATFQVWPPNPGNVQWRFGSAGLYSRALMTSLLGLLILLAVVTAQDKRVLIRVSSVLTAVFSVFLLATLMVFGLDALQTRSVLRLEARPGFDLATGFAMVKYVWAGVALLVLSIGGWRASRRLNRDPIAQTPLMQQAPRRETVQT